MDILQVIADELQIKKGQVEKSVELIDEGATIPFIARYRKEVTGSLNDEQLRALSERLVYLRNLEEKKASVLATIEEQGKLTDELKKQIEAVMTMVALEDLYRPYRPKRRTRATIAKEKGLEPLAEILRAQATTRTIEEEATAFVDAEKGVESVQDAIDGAKDILAEVYADDADYRTKLRAMTKESGSLVAKAKDEEADSVYEMYYDFSEPIKKLVGHRILAINRGEAEKFLTVKIEAPRQEILLWLVKQIIGNMKHDSASYLYEAITDSYDRLIAPSIEREIRNELTEKAEEGAIGVFGLLAVLAICLTPFITMAVQYLLYKLTAFLAGTVTQEPLADLIDALGSAFGLMLGMTGSCALALLISIISSVSVVGK